jgi:hypothetical protein
MAEIISEILGRTVRYRHVPLADFQIQMVQRGASSSLAKDMADMINAQNDGIYDAEPRDGVSATATEFHQWCRNVLEPAVQP